MFKLLEGKLADEKARLDTILKTDLPPLNKLLAGRKLAALTITKTETK